MPRPVTIKHVAVHAGVSIGTVSNVLNDAGGVGAETRERVLQSVATLGYRLNRAAQATRTGRTRMIAFVTPDLCNPFYPGLAKAVTNAARDAGYAVMLIDTQDGAAERASIEQAVHHGVDGLLWCPATADDVIAHSDLRAPVIVIDQWLDGRDCIAADYRMGARLIADHVRDRGYRRAGLISGPRDIPAARVRRDHLAGFLDGVAEIGWEITHPFSMTLTGEGRAMIARRDVDVLLCGDDSMAIAALRAALDMGLRIPQDLAVIGHDDIMVASVVRPAITTIRQSLQNIGSRAVDMLLDRMANPSAAARTVEIGVDLVIRDSTGV